MGFRKSRLIISFLFSSLYIFAQEPDFQTWINLEIKGELFNKLDYGIYPEVRTFDNSTRIATMLCEFDISAPTLKYFRIGVNYRPELDVSGEYASRRNRISVYGEAQYKLNRLRFGYRAMYMQEYKDFNTSENGHIPFIGHRQKISLKYNIKNCKISPSVSAEMFFIIKPVEEKDKKKLRLSVGMDYQVNKKLSCSIAYKYQREYIVDNPKSIHILSLSLGYEL